MDYIRRPGTTHAAHDELAKTWLTDIVEAILPDPERKQEGDEYKYSHAGGLNVNMRGRGWFDHSAKTGSRSAVKLVMHIRKCDYRGAVQWLGAFLAAHPGTGPCGIVDGGGDDDSNTEPASAADCRDILDCIKDDLTGTPSEAYLKSRGIAGPYPEGLLGHLDNARIGESALVPKLTASGRVVGVQELYLTPNGRKSSIEPIRRRHNLEKAPGAAFLIPAPDDLAGATDIPADIIVAEGVEDALSLALLGRNATIYGLPGIGALSALTVPAGKRVRVCRDGDAPGSGPDLALRKGLDHLLLQDAIVSVTAPPEGADSNSILQEGGTAALLQSFNKAEKAVLSREGEYERLSRLGPADYDTKRKETAKKFSLRLPTLDGEVAKRRRANAAAANAADPADDDGAARGRGHAVVIPTIEPWPEPVAGAGMLDDLAVGIRKYVVLHPYQIDAMALWCTFTHLADRFDVSPKLIVDSAQKRSGKSRTLEVADRLTAKPVKAASITAAAFVRVIDHHAPTLLLDEFDAMLKGDPDKAEALRGLLNSGFDRAGANRILSVPLPGGGWEERLFSTFCSQVIAGIGSMPDTVEDRSIILEMQRKRRADKVARLRIRDGDDLRVMARRIARWAVEHGSEVEAADPKVPAELNDRAADAWAPLLAIADVVGGDWPRRARAAAGRISGGENTDTLETQLLSDIRDAFAAQEEMQAPPRIASEALVSYLVALEDRPWSEINRGMRPLTKNGLARMLKPFHVSPGTVQIGNSKAAQDAKGYYLRQFADAFDRYLSPAPPIFAPSTVGTTEAEDFRGSQADSRPSEADGSDGCESPQLPSISAGPDVPTVEAGKIGGVRKKTSDGSPLPEPNASGSPDDLEDHAPASVSDNAAPKQPNGASSARKPRRISLIAARVRDIAASHPDWDAAQIGKECGRTASDVRRILDTEAPP